MATIAGVVIIAVLLVTGTVMSQDNITEHEVVNGTVMSQDNITEHEVVNGRDNTTTENATITTPSATIKDCRATWLLTPNTYYEDGEYLPTTRTVQGCRTACVNNASCTGIDYSLKRRNGKPKRGCWLVGPWSGASKDTKKVDHYQIIRNCPTAANKYKVTVYTGTEANAGTDAKVRIILFGDLGISGERILDTQMLDTFEIGSVDEFIIECQELGTLRRLSIWHDNSGEYAGWFLEKVVVDDFVTSREYVFPCDRWLAKDKDDGHISRELSGNARETTTTPTAATMANPRHYVNMAINRPSFMSSQFQSGRNFPASNGNDGDKTNCDGYGSIAHSLNEQNPWYAVDLGMALNVDFVNFTNRADCCAWRSKYFIVGLTDVSPNDKAPTLYNYDVCGQYPGNVLLGATVSVQCASNLPAHRYVIVQFPRNGAMNFCELEVFISPNPHQNVNVAFSRPSYMSSQKSDEYSASKGNDGDKWSCYPHGSMAISSDTPEQNPWYGVDLGVAMNVDSVNLTNYISFPYVSSPDNFIVGLTDVSPAVTAPTLYNYDDLCGQYPGAVPLYVTVSLQCFSNVTAHRYVIVQLPITGQLTLCELEVFTSP